MLLRLLLKVTHVTTGHQKLPKMGQNSIIRSFFARRAKKASAEGQSPPQELEVGPRSGPYLLVIIIIFVLIYSSSDACLAIVCTKSHSQHKTTTTKCWHKLIQGIICIYFFLSLSLSPLDNIVHN